MKTIVRRIALGVSLTATVLAGAAYAQQADRDAPVTRAQAQAKAQEMFARMDVNKDGKLDQADRDARRAAMRKEMFDRIDTDKNGQISRAEFDAARPPHDRRGPGDPEGRGPEAGGPGMPPPPPGAEGPGGPGQHRWGMRGGRGHHGGMMMGRIADANKDGAVTQAEFVAAAMQRFDRADTNKDGTVTKEERQAAHKAMRDEMRKHWQERAGQPAAAPKAN